MDFKNYKTDVFHCGFTRFHVSPEFFEMNENEKTIIKTLLEKIVENNYDFNRKIEVPLPANFIDESFFMEIGPQIIKSLSIRGYETENDGFFIIVLLNSISFGKSCLIFNLNNHTIDQMKFEVDVFQKELSRME